VVFYQFSPQRCLVYFLISRRPVGNVFTFYLLVYSSGCLTFWIISWNCSQHLS